jgi:hypothetical protein
MITSVPSSISSLEPSSSGGTSESPYKRPKEKKLSGITTVALSTKIVKKIHILSTTAHCIIASMFIALIKSIGAFFGP